MEKIKIELALIEDLPEILKLQKLAYQSEAEIYNDFTIPPLIQTLEGTKTDFSHQVFLKVVIDNKIIGSVRASQEGETCYISRLIVHPDFQNQGIGTKLMNEIENMFKDAKRFELFAGHKSSRNLYLYQKLGYKVFKREKMNNNDIEIAFLEKHRK